MKTILAVMNTTQLVAKIMPEKIQALTGLKPMNSAIPEQCSIN